MFTFVKISTDAVPQADIVPIVDVTDNPVAHPRSAHDQGRVHVGAWREAMFGGRRQGKTEGS